MFADSAMLSGALLTVDVEGYAASSASIVAMAGDDIRMANGFATDAVETLAIAAMGDSDRHGFRAFPAPLELEEPIPEVSKPQPVDRQTVDVKTRLHLTRARSGV